jgi:hypothetical protein
MMDIVVLNLLFLILNGFFAGYFYSKKDMFWFAINIVPSVVNFAAVLIHLIN